LLLHVSELRLHTWGYFGFRFLVPCAHVWVFMKDCIGLGSGCALVCFFVSRLEGRSSGSMSIPSASYSQVVKFYHPFHIGKEGLATKVVTVIELQP
jgi:hypothetical protein